MTHWSTLTEAQLLQKASQLAERLDHEDARACILALVQRLQSEAMRRNPTGSGFQCLHCHLELQRHSDTGFFLCPTCGLLTAAEVLGR
jgi:hypothetical protein